MLADKLGVAALGARFMQRASSADSWDKVSNPPTAPKSDSFYDASSVDLSGYSKGDIIRYREVGIQNVGNSGGAWQVMFRSEDHGGNAIAGVSTVIIPNRTPNNYHLVSYQMAADSPNVNCAGSYSIAEGNDSGFDAAWDENRIISTCLGRGWVVNIPDHEGLNGTFTSGISGGKIVLDSLRAFNNGNSFIKRSVDKQAIWGFSGGSVATGWAAELQSSYARDVNIAVAGMGGFIVDPAASVQAANSNSNAGYVGSILAGLGSEYTDVWNAIYRNVKPDGLSSLTKPLDQCLNATLSDFNNKDVLGDTFNNGVEILSEQEVYNAMQSVKLGQNTPSMPIYIYNGIEDEVAPVYAVDSVYKAYCSGGASVNYLRKSGITHDNTQDSMAGQMYSFLQYYFYGNGNRISGCNIDGAPTSVLASSAAASMSYTPSDAGKNGSGAAPTNAASSSSASVSAATDRTAATSTSASSVAGTASSRTTSSGSSARVTTASGSTSSASTHASNGAIVLGAADFAGIFAAFFALFA